jgi:putative hydrolase of HD superfamily
MTGEAQLLALLENGLRLKQTPRTGWVQRGVPQPESVAAHSYGVALAVLVLAHALPQPLDTGRALQMALLHDLPEALTGDIATPARRFFPDGNGGAFKAQIERNALAEMVGDLPLAPVWHALHAELVAEESAESRLVHDADKLDLYAQAWQYEQQTGNRLLAEFWQKPPRLHFDITRRLVALLVARRAEREL